MSLITVETSRISFSVLADSYCLHLQINVKNNHLLSEFFETNALKQADYYRLIFTPPPPDCLETSCSSCYPVSFMAKVVPATVRLIKCLELQPYASIINKIIFLKTSGTIKENSDN